MKHLFGCTVVTLLSAVSLLASQACAVPANTQNHDNADFFPPVWGGGFQLMNANNGYGEPLNVIISGKSTPEVLTKKGFLNWARSVGFSYECLGLHGGGYMSADLGDGKGWAKQLAVYRESYSNAHIGTCLETFVGGNHFRIYRQDGPKANTGALFLAVSHEEDLGDKHKISPNGYDLGRDELVALATGGPTEYDDVVYNATSRDLHGLLEPGKRWINHGIEIDGVVTLLTINIVKKDDD